MSHSRLKITQTIHQLERLIQTDLAQRGIHQIPGDNLCTHTRGNLYRAIKFLAENPGCQVGIVTGFYIPTANPPAPENDGPPGALFLARGLKLLGYPVVLITDPYCFKPLQQGIEIFKHQINSVELIEFPFEPQKIAWFEKDFFQHNPQLNCLIAIERVGPCHTMASFLSNTIPADEAAIVQFKTYGPGSLAGECLNMRAIPITAYTAPVHRLFEKAHLSENHVFTIGIGDGGNEIGMGSIPWPIISKNILNGLGGKIACRVPTDATLVAGVSNWAGYALIAGLYLYRDRFDDFLNLYSAEIETKLIELYYRSQSVVDGTRGYPAMSVDGIEWEIHLGMIDLLMKICKEGNSKIQKTNPK